jgi:hypothetical protein
MTPARNTSPAAPSACLLAIVVALPACHSLPDYRGDGTISNTSSRRDGTVFPVREYTVKLASFPLNTNLTHEFQLGEVAFFPKTTMAISIRFQDAHSWWHYKHLTPPERDERTVANRNMRDIDTVQGRLSYRVLSETGAPLLTSDTPLSECDWAQSPGRDPRHNRVEIRDGQSSLMGVEKGYRLRLWFQYSGDQTMTNMADLILRF